jgi:hypothetical protein
MPEGTEPVFVWDDYTLSRSETIHGRSASFFIHSTPHSEQHLVANPASVLFE